MNTDTLKVSVIIPAYFRPELLEKAVRSCLNQNFPSENYEVIVVDSSPNDDNFQVIEALKPLSSNNLKCLRKKPEGPGPSRNLGAEMAKGEILAFLDSDCQASSTWLSGGVSCFGEKVGLVQGKTTPEEGKDHSIFNQSFTILSENFIYQALNIFYRRDVFLELGGFLADKDPNSLKVLGGEDVDLAWRVKRVGWDSRFCAKASVTHVVERITPWQWLFDKRMVVVPRIPKDFPETRPHFYARYFFDKVQASFVLALIGLILCSFSLYALLLILPYAIKRGSEPTRALPGPLRVARIFFYFPKDLLNFIQLVRGSLRFKTILL